MPTHELFNQIQSSENILLISHRRPDPDTLGSATALAFLIQKNFNKQPRVFCIDPIPENCKFLGVEQFIIKQEDCDFNQFDLIIAVDCADAKITGIPELSAKSVSNPLNPRFAINIDHHATNTHYAGINIINPIASSTAEVVYDLIKTGGYPLNKEISTALLAGIISDTDNFTNAGTSAKTMNIAADLLKNQAQLKLISKNLSRKIDHDSLKIWGRVLSQLHYNEEYKILCAIVQKENNVELEGLANFLLMLYEPNIMMVIKEEADAKLKFSLRTTKDDIDVSKIAQHFGGGGHRKAAGFSIDGRLQRTEEGWEIF